jgi:hypothetical protein
MSLLSRFADERFLEHRRRATSNAGILCAVSALLLFMYRHYVSHRWAWDLLAVALIFLLVKYALFFWYRLNR